MSQLTEKLDLLCQAALHPAQTVAQSCRSTGKPAIGCFPIYTPEEIIYAGGFLPVGMWGGNTEIKLADRYLQSFCCSIMRSNIEYGCRGVYNDLKAIVLPTFCDTLKCICENWKVAVPQVPILPIVYPQNRMLAAGQLYLKQEFERIRGELEKLAGHPITADEIEQAFAVYEHYRAAMRDFCDKAAAYPHTINAKIRHLVIKAGWFMDKALYTQYIRDITALLQQLPPEKAAVRIVATGLLAEPLGVLDLLVENDIAIVGDDLAQESRQWRVLSRSEGTALDRMVGRIADMRGCTFLYEPEKTRGELLIRMAHKQQADGVITMMMKFCDPEEFDYPIYKAELETAQIPLLYLELEQQMDSFEQLRTRIQSFAEMLA